MKRIKATATITREIIAEITISYEDKKSLGISSRSIAMKYMETNFPGIDDWSCEEHRGFVNDTDEIGSWFITIYREEKALIFEEK